MNKMKENKPCKKRCRIQYLHKLHEKGMTFENDLVLNNFFIAEFPEELNINYHDIISIMFINEYRCVVKIINNYENFPLFSLNLFKTKQRSIFRKKSDIIIKHLDRNGDIRYISKLKDIKIFNIFEDELTYLNDNTQTITFEVSFKKRILEKYESTH